MEVIIGNEKKYGIDFRLTLYRCRSNPNQWAITSKSIREALNFKGNEYGQLLERTKHIPREIVFSNTRGNSKCFTLTNAIEYIDNLNKKTKPIAQLLMMNLATELSWLTE